MKGARSGAAAQPDLMSRIEASRTYALKPGDMVRRSTGPHDFLQEIQNAMDAIGNVVSLPAPASRLMERLRLDTIPMVRHHDLGSINNGMFISDSEGSVYKFHVGMMDGLPVFSSLAFKKQAPDHRPKVVFFDEKGNIDIRHLRRHVDFIEQLRLATSINEGCTMVFAKVALICNGAIQGRNYVFCHEEIRDLIRLCGQFPALTSGPQQGSIFPMPRQMPVRSSPREGFHVSDRNSATTAAHLQGPSHLLIENPGRSQPQDIQDPSSSAIKESDSRESSVSASSSTLRDMEMERHISDPSEFLTIDAAMREDEESGQADIQAADAKIEKIARQKEKLERSLAKAIEKKRVGQDKIQKAERWKKDSMARLTPSLRAFWEAASKNGKLPDAS